MDGAEEDERMLERVVPFTAMVLMEGCTIVLTIMANSAMEHGMNQLVFVAYSNAFSSLLLLPSSCFFPKHMKFWRMRETLSFNLLVRLFLLGFIGISMAQNIAFTGLRYSSPIVVCSMGLLLPCFHFFLALLQRKTKLELRRTSGKLRVGGILVSFTGAAVVAAYKGPSILQDALFKPGLLHSPHHPLFVFVSTTHHHQWLLGCLLLASATFFLALWTNLQVSTLKQLSNTTGLVAWYVHFGTIQTVIVDLLAEHDLSAWRLSINLELAVIIFTAVFGTLVKSRVHEWCVSTKGVMYVSLFKPCGIFWACIISLSFFGSTLHIGSLMGAVVSGIGYYTMLWATIKEEAEMEINESNNHDPNFMDDQLKAHLLKQGEDQV